MCTHKIVNNLPESRIIISFSKMGGNGPEQDTLRHSAKGATASGFCTMLAAEYS
jgi:hypothetical protein